MRRLAPALGALLLLAGAGAPAAALALEGRVRRVVDGDTVYVVSRGFETPVRLLGIDTPETRSPTAPVQCWGPQSSARTRRLLPRGMRVRLVTDPTQDVRDRFGRLLAYVYRDSRATSVNHALVATGYARAYVHDPARPFRYAAGYLRAESRARARRLGLWGPPCDGRTTVPRPAPVPAGACDPSYPTVCIPPPPPDLDCDDIRFRSFRVLPPDPHRFDGGGDGVGCEG